MAKILSRNNYESRKNNLLDLITAADRVHGDAVLALELGDGEEDAVAKAKSDADGLRERLRNLHAAWERQMVILAEQIKEEDASLRREAVAAAVEILNTRIAIAERINAAAKKLATEYSKYLDAGEKALAAVRPYLRHLGPDGPMHLSDEVRGFVSRPDRAIVRVLHDGGLDLSGVNWDSARYEDRGVTEHAKGALAQPVQRLQLMLPEEDR